MGQRGEPLSAHAIYDVVVKYGHRAGLEDVTPHTLRHTFARALIASGAPLSDVADLLGHSSLDTTRIYTKASVKRSAHAWQTFSRNIRQFWTRAAQVLLPLILLRSAARFATRTRGTSLAFEVTRELSRVGAPVPVLLPFSQQTAN